MPVVSGRYLLWGGFFIPELWKCICYIGSRIWYDGKHGAYERHRIDRLSISQHRPELYRKRHQWVVSSVNEALQSVPVASITVVNTFDTVTKELSVTVSATFSQNVSGDYRLGGAVIVEDGVTGPQPQYNQSNSYSGGGYGPMGGFETLPFFYTSQYDCLQLCFKTVTGRVCRRAWKLARTHKRRRNAWLYFSYILPEDRDEDLVYVIAWLIKPDGKIDNAIKSPYLNGNDNAKPVFYPIRLPKHM